jgi:ATP-dependent helicase/nuclease subunit A
MVRALKAAEVPVAGADRMVLAEQLAVMDLVALARFVLLPQDDLNLATVLKGPLFGLDDDDLFALCHGRAGRAWTALNARADERPHWRRARDELAALLARADYVRPFEFFAELLGAGGARARIAARLGPEANDPLDEFVSLALAYERQNAPTLEGFLAWFAAGGAEVKRDMEQNRDEARVMTVHGAKGLEANIVFLPDTCTIPDGRNDPRVLWTDDKVPLPLWPIRSGNDEAACTAARDDGRRSRVREYRRLLYVAATRARDRLYVCGWQGPTRPAGCWYDLIAPAIETHARAARLALASGEPAWRLEAPQSGTCEADSAPPIMTTVVGNAPDWAARAAPVEPSPPRPLAPSRPDAEPSVRSPLDAGDGARFKRGRLVHRLLQSLPELPLEARAPACARFLARAAHALEKPAQADIARETLAVLAAPDFAALFGAPGAAEIPIVGRLKDRVISAQIDRLVVTEDAVLVLDYKTNRPAPRIPADVPRAYLAQMAAYRAAIATIYPGRTVRCCLLWTDGPRLMELPPALLDLHAPA